MAMIMDVIYRIGVSEAPSDLRDLDPERVYYFAFADDLA
jgi:hypothetical protein